MGGPENQALRSEPVNIKPEPILFPGRKTGPARHKPPKVPVQTGRMPFDATPTVC
jgi:hypothetical protein